MKVFSEPIPCSRCGELDISAVLGATTVLEQGNPLFPSRVLIYCQRCMTTSHGEHLVVLKQLMDVTWGDLSNYIRQGYLRLGVLGVTLGDETQKKLTDELDRQVLINYAMKSGKTKKEAAFLLTKKFSYNDLYQFFDSDVDKIIMHAVPISDGK